jgi:serine protease Do
MKQAILKMTAFIIGGLMMAPAFAQDDKEKASKDKEKKDHEQIIIHRESGDNEKMVIEINGDKVTVNGKPIEDMKDGSVKVHRYKIKDPASYRKIAGANGDVYRLLTEEANHAMLGVTTEKVDEGAKIKDITPESAAEKIGLKEGDIIIKINETKIEEPDGLAKAIRAQKPGDKVQVTYIRDKKTQTATAELTKWKSSFKFDMPNLDFKMPDINVNPRVQAIPRSGQAWTWSGGSPKLGLSVQDTDDGKGVKVIEVDEDSNAAKAGVKENDVITEIDGKAVNTTDEVVKIIKESKEKNAINLKLNRGGKSQSIEVKMPKKIKTADL